MATVRRDQEAVSLDGLNNLPGDLPPISALFLIYFDIKAGYTIGWKRSLPGIELEGVVEYKSLPSGLHTVKEDLVYFVHDDHAGLSAFANAPASEEARNARMIAVGVMVPLSYGRLGRCWRHAEKLKSLANELVADSKRTKNLEEFWERHKVQASGPDAESDSPPTSPTSVTYEPLRTASLKRKGHGRSRSASDGTALLRPENTLTPYHPAWSLPDLLDTFGPLIFPVLRAALLRKRILIVTHAPVEQTCNYIYDLSVLSNIPLAVCDLLSDTAPLERLRPLFSIGVHDIPILEDNQRTSKAHATDQESGHEEGGVESEHGWIACTTDSILATKHSLYDVLITMPPPFAQNASEKVWPKVESSKSLDIKATQRDLRRYRSLRQGLSLLTTPPPSPLPRSASSGAQGLETSRSISLPTLPRERHLVDMPDTDGILEPLSWSALAYSGFMWWASAGEQRIHSDDEFESDNALLSGLSMSAPRVQSQNQISQSLTSLKAEGDAHQEMAIIAYFHRLTTQILTTLSDIADATDSDDEREDNEHLLHEGESDPALYVTTADMVRMGLDVWSLNDHKFIEDMAQEYFGRKAQVEGESVDICGIRIC